MFALLLVKLTLVQILSDIPHDVGALIVYTLVALSVALVWLGNRGRGGDTPARPDRHPAP